MTTNRIAAIACAAFVVACGGSSGGGGDSCNTGLFATAASYSGKEDVVGVNNCVKYLGVAFTATITQTQGTCDAALALHTSSASHTCSGQLNGYDLPFTCTDGYHGAVAFQSDLSTFSGSFQWTAGSCSGTTTFESGVTRTQ
jgi:hypothetical protein